MLNAEEHEEFRDFHSKTFQSLAKKAYRLCSRNSADADDLLQNTYLKAMQHWSTLSGKADDKRDSWMATTLMREALQLWRTPYRSREVGSDTDLDHASNGSVPPSVEETVIGLARFREACRAIAEMEPRVGEVMALHCIAGYATSEIAKMLEITPATVRVHIHIGRKPGLRPKYCCCSRGCDEPGDGGEQPFVVFGFTDGGGDAVEAELAA